MNKMNNTFFERQVAASEVKSRLVSDYFTVWSKIMLGGVAKTTGLVAYIDLFAGPGRYKDGTISTPLMVLETAINEPRYHTSLVALFNDANPENVENLRLEIDRLPSISNLVHKPVVACSKVDQQAEDLFNSFPNYPSFTFLDPWGYKDISLNLIRSALKNKGSECVFFFNFRRINAAVSNDLFSENMEKLFGIERSQKLQETVKFMNKTEREIAVVSEMKQAIKESGIKYVLPFSFKSKRGNATHHIIFVSNNFKGYELMKTFMVREHTWIRSGNQPLGFSETEANSSLFFFLDTTLDDLCKELVEFYSGETLSVKDVYERHTVDRPYVKKDYKEVLKKLEKDGLVNIIPAPGKIRSKHGLADHLIVSFPRK